MEASVEMIGGADGPTSLFVAEKYDMTDLDEAIRQYILEHNDNMKENPLQVVAYRKLDQEETEERTLCCLYYGQFGYYISTEAQLADYWTPQDGGLLDDDVRKIFPKDIQEEAIMAHSKYREEPVMLQPTTVASEELPEVLPVK